MGTDLTPGQRLVCPVCNAATLIKWRPRRRTIRCQGCQAIIAMRANDDDPGRAVKIN
jgi:DNA-directed RNA polymerase subunit RPC12/RpoP